MSCAKYFCVSNVVNVMIHATITKRERLKIVDFLSLDLLGGALMGVVSDLERIEYMNECKSVDMTCVNML